MSTIRIVYPELATEDGPAEIFNEGDNLDVAVIEDQPAQVEVTGDDPVAITGSRFPDTIIGGAGSDSISGGEGADVIDSGPGNDVLDIGSGDTVSSGDGEDVFVFDLSQEMDPANPPEIVDLAPEDGFALTGTDTEDSVEAPVYDRETGVLLLGTEPLVDVGTDIDPSTITFVPDPEEPADPDAPAPVVPEAPSIVDSGDITVYRFYDGSKGVHFYTVDVVERDYVLNNLDNYDFEGESYSTVDPITGEGAEEVYRFFNPTTGVHLYTTSEVERDSVRENLDNFTYEGVKFYAHETEAEGSMPVYRFYEPTLGVHFYTPNELEKDSVMENLDNYTYEGIAYYADPLVGDM